MTGQEQKIALVGPCGSGKSSLAVSLGAAGLTARQIAQEHSYVGDMWQVISDPEILIYLHASFPVCTARKGFSWTEAEYQEQIRRLEHAREHCQIFVDTTDLDKEQTLQAVMEQLQGLL